MTTAVRLPDGSAICTTCTRLYRTVHTAKDCTHDPALVDRRPPWNEDPPQWAVVIAMVVIWIAALTVFVIMPAYIAFG